MRVGVCCSGICYVGDFMMRGSKCAKAKHDLTDAAKAKNLTDVAKAKQCSSDNECNSEIVGMRCIDGTCQLMPPLLPPLLPPVDPQIVTDASRKLTAVRQLRSKDSRNLLGQS